MPKIRKRKSRILSEVREAAKDLRDIGVIDAATMRKFDSLAAAPSSTKGSVRSPKAR